MWRKKDQVDSSSKKKQKGVLEESQRRLGLVKEIEKVRKRREDRELELEEQERLRAEEVRQ